MAVTADPHGFLARYLRGDLAEFFAVPAGDTAAALAIDRPVDRAALVRALRRQAERLGAPAQALANLERLEHPHSRVVVTGQQTGLLLGPLFTLSKAFTAIRLARSLDSEQRPVVPLFWLASQDHDHAEIDHAYLLDFDEELLRVEIALPPDIPSGRMPFREADLEGLLAQLARGAFKEYQLAAVGSLLRGGAERADTVADWFGALMYRLLGEYGLLLLDPLDREIAALGDGVLRREIADPLPTVEEVRSAGDRLRALGITPQLGRGGNASNLFFERSDRGGVRTPLKCDHSDFVAGDRRLSAADLLAALEDDPSLVTPAAALRPVTQDALLPTAAIVVGPGELRYYAQLRGVYEFHGVPMPLVWPRAEATVLEPPVRRILDRYGLGAAEFMADPDGIRGETLLALHGHLASFGQAASGLEREIGTLIESVREIDPSLIGAVERARRHLDTTVARLRDKSAAALARRDRVVTDQFGRLSRHLLPLGTPQERIISPFGLFLKFGIDPVMELFAGLPSEGEHILEIV